MDVCPTSSGWLMRPQCLQASSGGASSEFCESISLLSSFSDLLSHAASPPGMATILRIFEGFDQRGRLCLRFP